VASAACASCAATISGSRASRRFCAALLCRAPHWLRWIGLCTAEYTATVSVRYHYLKILARSELLLDALVTDRRTERRLIIASAIWVATLSVVVLPSHHDSVLFTFAVVYALAWMSILARIVVLSAVALCAAIPLAALYVAIRQIAKARYIAAAAWLIVPATIPVAYLLVQEAGRKPTDAELIARFHTHRTEIETLMSMMRADNVLVRVDDNWTRPANPASVGIGARRIATYRRILNDIGFRRGFYYDPKSGNVTFLAWSVGLAFGASKSIMFLPGENPTPLVEDVDAYKPPQGADHLVAYRHLEGSWYLEFDSD
jgi:hypothetical protein